MRATDHTGCCCAQIADHRAHNTPFSTYVTEVVCDFGAAPPQAATSSPAIEGMTPSKPPTRRRHAAKELRMARNPHRHRSGGCRIAYKNGTVSVGATKLAQQQPRRAASVQNSPCSPEMAQFGAVYACGASFVPLSPPRTQAGRILYRTQGRVGASHDTTTGTTSAEGTGATTGTRRMTGGRTLRHPEHLQHPEHPWGHTAQHSWV